MADIAPSPVPLPPTSTSHAASLRTTTKSPSPSIPTPPSSLLAALHCTAQTHLIVGSNPLAAARCAQSLSAGARPILLAPEPADDEGQKLHYALRSKIDDGSVRWEKKPFEDGDLFRLGREEVDGVVDAVFVTSGRDKLAPHIASLCRRNRIPINVVDSPHLCTFTLLSTHTDGPLQIGITTNGRGCKLASRIRREISSSLPPNLGDACARLGEIRKRVQDADGVVLREEEEESAGQGAEFNKLVGVKKEEEREELKTRRMRWLAQVCEYWPLKRLATIADSDVETILNTYPSTSPSSPLPSPSPSPFSESLPPLGRIILAGSGPGHPSLLTLATQQAIQTADLVLADKLVPSPVLDLIPRRTPVQIARKFPGNADAAQEELLTTALAAIHEGKTVLRLKQGDPYVYGRGGEEVKFFWENGILGDRVVVLPGVTSALSAPLFAQITSTQRDVADQVLICTGTGKKGKPPTPPEYVASRTVVFLMALHRISGLIAELTTPLETEIAYESGETKELKRALWPLDTPCAVVERASCPDQRVIRTTLERVAEAIESEGSRPPGLLVVGRACEVLKGSGEKGWVVEEGFRGLDGLGIGEMKGLSCS